MKPVLPAILLAPLLLVACAPTPPSPVVVVELPAGDSCGASRYQSLIGQTGPALMLPGDAVYRVFKTGDPVTSDFNAARLNFETDKRGKLLHVTCG
ncbi:hypothetical protein GL279_04105 [Paracoccus limosus]|uniref:Peptidase inhibitor I78 n=1 Tax=Paracoccus limosus TaxID=913252 RepID=A0A844H2I6_9RHOB|nr:I78 family peptidase inhibitor [Paracoccus limosus]MTH33774.1 hypothetical protein [Paracoccus limosus]